MKKILSAFVFAATLLTIDLAIAGVPWIGIRCWKESTKLGYCVLMPTQQRIQFKFWTSSNFAVNGKPACPPSNPKFASFTVPAYAWSQYQKAWTKDPMLCVDSRFFEKGK